jgi:hypothetical protein
MTIYNRKNQKMSQSKDIRDLLHQVDYSRAMDLRGSPIGDVCVCGCDVFIMLAGFIDGDIGFWFTDGECAGCGSMVTLPTPIDGDDDANL